MPRMRAWETPTGRVVMMAADEADDWKRLGADAEGRLPLTYRRLRGMYPELRLDPVAGDHACD
jgi:hypothetical protein